MNILNFFISSFIIILIPGSGVIYTISTGMIQGKRASVFAALGCTMGILPHLCVSIVLTSYLMKMNYKAFLILKLIGSLYLIYLGINIMRSKVNFKLANKPKQKASSIVLSGMLINSLNPMLTFFFLSFLPQYATGKYYITECLLYGLTFMLLTLLVFIGYGLLAGITNQFFINSPKRISVIQKLFAIVFILFAIRLASSSI